MLLYDSIGPNPKVVRMFMAERGISGIPTETIDLRAGENRREPFLSKNPTGTMSGTGAGQRHGARGDHRDLRIPR